MVPIEDVMANKFFYHSLGIEQAGGLNKVTSAMLWNPVDSGVVVAIRQNLVYSAPFTAMNYKWRTTPFGATYSGPRNSLALKNPTSALGQSKAVAYTDKVGSNVAVDNANNYILFPVNSNAAVELVPDPPPVLYPGTGFIVYPDTAAAVSWTWAVTFEEHPLPTT